MFNPFPFRRPYSLRLAKASAFLPASWRFTHRILTVLRSASPLPALADRRSFASRSRFLCIVFKVRSPLALQGFLPPVSLTALPV